MKSLFVLMIFAGASAFAQVSIGIQIGAPPSPRVVRVLPPRPGPQFVWVEGYWYPERNHYKWHSGYWTRPVYPDARWVAPRYERGRYFTGYWDGDTGRRDHDHHSDRDRYRDSKDSEHDRGRGRRDR